VTLLLGWPAHAVSTRAAGEVPGARARTAPSPSGEDGTPGFTAGHRAVYSAGRTLERSARRLREWTGTRATKLDSDPFAGSAAEGLYDLLFADAGDRSAPASPPLDRAIADTSDRASLRSLAGDSSAESRKRILAFRRLDALDPAEHQERPPFLGVVVEIGLDEGLDVLAAYVDGSVRYLNHAGSPFISEDSPAIRPEVTALLGAAEPVARAIGPWKEPRRPAPEKGMLRLTFLVGGEIRFGEGRITAHSVDPMGGPVFVAATRLLTNVATKFAHPPPGLVGR
jgi:hypothetical protein